MKVLAIVGMPGSGKSEAATVAAEHGIPVVTMGDVIREVSRERGRGSTEEALGEVATALREEAGPAAVADRSIPQIETHLENHDVVLVDGVRGIAEVERFEEAFDDSFQLVSIEAPFEIRLDRIRKRGRDPSADGRADLQRRDSRERGYGMDEAMDHADVTVHNTGGLEEFRAFIRELLHADEAPEGASAP